MGYPIKAGLGIVLFLGGVYVFNLTLQELLDIGTCASGNVPYEIRPEYQCPEGIGTKFFLIFGSVIVGLVGCALFAFRGDPPWGERKYVGSFGWGMLAWGLFFAGTGAALMIGAPYGESVDPNTGEVVGRPDSQLGATITGITFLVMGVPALLLGLWSVFKGLSGRDERPGGSGGGLAGWNDPKESIPTMGNNQASSSSRRSSSKGSADTIGRLERLQKLHEEGALTRAEFDREKAKILAEQ